MDGIKTGIIATRDGWEKRIEECNKEERGNHTAIVSSQIITGATNLNLEPPYLCYSILREKSNISGDINYHWLHVCFTPVDAGTISALHDERYKIARTLQLAESEKDKDKRLSELTADLELDLETEESLGTIGMKEALTPG